MCPRIRNFIAQLKKEFDQLEKDMNRRNKRESYNELLV